ncbi:hypothetical protein BCU68_09220 [Vibrio sp. 10N.286.49.B3]|uniref:hypothetical protein n=1 Tax=Vibrio sp. 10N.286.49.B3 TaxID=1880855 RepID=UPI000C82DC99|nr:hypothetical protein [Vibrio sp. 10N.286.49.B3]PMH45965.1 hypothetical protein BCU68_09220 [Vibrio sp. 10N.286.49.B3]
MTLLVEWLIKAHNQSVTGALSHPGISSLANQRWDETREMLLFSQARHARNHPLGDALFTLRYLPRSQRVYQRTHRWLMAHTSQSLQLVHPHCASRVIAHMALARFALNGRAVQANKPPAPYDANLLTNSGVEFLSLFDPLSPTQATQSIFSQVSQLEQRCQRYVEQLEQTLLVDLDLSVADKAVSKQVIKEVNNDAL